MNAGSFGEDQHWPPGRKRLLAGGHHLPERLRARASLDRNHAITPRQEAEERNVGELALNDDDRQLREADHLGRFEHRLMLDGDQVGALGDDAFDLGVDAEDAAGQPVVELDPAQHDRQRRTEPQPVAVNAGENLQSRASIEETGVNQRPRCGHQRSTQTARRRNTYLLYSPNNVRKLGPVRTPSGTIRYFEPRTLSNS